MVVAVFASVSTEARVGVLFWVVMVVRWLNGDLDGHWLLVNDWKWHVLLVDDWAVDWNVDWIRHWLLDDIWDLLDDLVGLWDWDWNLHCDFLLNVDWVGSVWVERIGFEVIGRFDRIITCRLEHELVLSRA